MAYTYPKYRKIVVPEPKLGWIYQLDDLNSNETIECSDLLPIFKHIAHLFHHEEVPEGASPHVPHFSLKLVRQHDFGSHAEL